jgi:hypothetical protein
MGIRSLLEKEIAMLFRSLFNCLTPRAHKSKRSRLKAPPARSCRLAVEPLEDRRTPAAVFAIGDVAILEGNAGTLNAMVVVTLSEPHGNSCTVNYATSNGTATAGSDYNAVSGKLTFAKGQTSKSILVPVRGDRAFEADESFFVRLSNAKGAKIADNEGIVVITDNEPRISVDDRSVLEGHSGDTPLDFTVSLSSAYDQVVAVNYTTLDDSATAGSDYVAAAATLTFQPGQTSQTVTVLVQGDRDLESSQQFLLSLSNASSNAEITKSTGYGVIIDDEPQITISDAWNYGDMSPFIFYVSLSAPCDEVVTVNFATVEGTAQAGVDYVAASGTLTFAIGETSKTITIDVVDPTSMPDKYFYVQLSGASSNAFLGDEWGVGYWYYDYGYYYYDYGYYDYGYYGYYDYGYYYY